jgi:pilus assembly protein CpaB
VTSAFGGLLRPGDRVDVLLTTDRGDGEVTIPLLQNVLVLAVGTDTGADHRPEAAADGTSGRQLTAGPRRFSEVTFSVTIEQAGTLTHASTNGQIALALRNPDDIAITDRLPETTQGDYLEAEQRARLLRRADPVDQRIVAMPVRLGEGGRGAY